MGARAGRGLRTPRSRSGGCTRRRRTRSASNSKRERRRRRRCGGGGRVGRDRNGRGWVGAGSGEGSGGCSRGSARWRPCAPPPPIQSRTRSRAQEDEEEEPAPPPKPKRHVAPLPEGARRKSEGERRAMPSQQQQEAPRVPMELPSDEKLKVCGWGPGSHTHCVLSNGGERGLGVVSEGRDCARAHAAPPPAPTTPTRARPPHACRRCLAIRMRMRIWGCCWGGCDGRTRARRRWMRRFCTRAARWARGGGWVGLVGRWSGRSGVCA